MSTRGGVAMIYSAAMNRIAARLEALQQEYASGERLLAELDQKRQNLTSTLLRIEGAMTVLRELIAAEGDGGDAARASDDADVDDPSR